MLTLYTMKGDAMHVLPLPFGLALALYRRLEVPEVERPKASWSADPSSVRESIRTESRFAAVRQRFVS
jgi:hypothetical protein